MSIKQIIVLSIIIVFHTFSLCGQSVTIKGKVFDQDGSTPLSGAHIIISGRNNWTSSAINGDYALHLPLNERSTIVFSYVGYVNQSVTLIPKADSLINVVLKTDEWLSDAIVYGGARQMFNSNSNQISAISISPHIINQIPSTTGEADIMKTLQKFPGVTSMSDGTSGIYVRGGNYDQNLITIDGCVLYNSEHLRGYVSSINADMVENVVLYKGGFPAKYGSRISSVVDIGIKEGDLENYHGNISVGTLNSNIHLEGPIIKGRTSYNIGLRASYYELIALPTLRRIYKDSDLLNQFSKMDYYDVNLKLSHVVSNNDKVSMIFYLGKDYNQTSPNDSLFSYKHHNTTYKQYVEVDGYRNNLFKDNYGNIATGVTWAHRIRNGYSMNTKLNFSRFSYHQENFSEIMDSIAASPSGKLLEYVRDSSSIGYLSKIGDVSASVEFNNRLIDRHSMRWGIGVSLQSISPLVTINRDYHSIFYNINNSKYTEYKEKRDSTIGEAKQLQTYSVYFEDDINISDRWGVNGGLRVNLYGVKEKAYLSVEPRVSARFLLRDGMSLKASYSKMSQGVQILTSNNLVLPTNLWVHATKDIPIVTSHQFTAGYNYTIVNGLELTIEGYYKIMNNVIEYYDGASFMRTSSNWDEYVFVGDGRAYGVEFLLQKYIGKATGWISYTWSKSLRLFDRPNQELNASREFFAKNDRRHNLNIVFLYNFNKNFSFSATWRYLSGSRGSFAYAGIYGGDLIEMDPYTNPLSSEHSKVECTSEKEHSPIYFYKYLRYLTYKNKNDFMLPDIHSLDISFDCKIPLKTGLIGLNFSVTNVYNHKNITSVYRSTDRYRNVILKGICMFPIMPSVTIGYKF